MTLTLHAGCGNTVRARSAHECSREVRRGRTAMARSDKDVAVDTGGTDQSERASASPPRRIHVAVTPDMLAAIDRLIDREGITLTEAVRRLIAYGDVVYRMVKEEGQTMVFRKADGSEREVLL